MALVKSKHWPKDHTYLCQELGFTHYILFMNLWIIIYEFNLTFRKTVADWRVQVRAETCVAVRWPGAEFPGRPGCGAFHDPAARVPRDRGGKLFLGAFRVPEETQGRGAVQNETGAKSGTQSDRARTARSHPATRLYLSHGCWEKYQHSHLSVSPRTRQKTRHFKIRYILKHL